MPYIANKPGTAFRSFTDKDTFTGDGSTTTFDMQFAIAEAGQNDLQVFVNDVRQIPGDDYTLGVDGTGEYKRVTFTSAPTNSHAIVILNPGTVQGEFSSVADNAITSGKLNVDAITGQTELAEQAADGDEYLIHDTSAGALKRIAASNVTPNETLITGKTALGEGAATGDLLLIYDTSAGVLKKITQTNLLNFPSVSSVSPTNLTSGDGTGNYTIVITGSGFTGATAKLLKSDNATEISFDSQTVDSETQITGTIAKSSLSNADEDFGVRVTAGSGLQSSLNQQISIDAQPAWSTASGTIATVFDSARASGAAYTVAAADPESGGDITYTLESGSLPAGMSGSSTSSGYVISGTPDAQSSDTTSTFTIRAADVNSNTTDREFSITIKGPTVASFTSSGTFSVPSGVSAVDVLVIAGGGSGANAPGNGGGGGGAGGLIYRPGFTVTPGGTVTVTVGCGGPYAASSSPRPAGIGQDSIFGTLTAKGGGAGGTHNQNALSGGSGGGGGRDGGQGNSATQPTQSGDSGNYGFGNAGGNAGPGGSQGAGGGGGSGGPGYNGWTPDADPRPSTATWGGAGKSYSISGTAVVYAGGGSGSAQRYVPANPASGGGGGYGNTTATANRGSGGGAGWDTSSPDGPSFVGGAGGKGIVIVSY